MLLNCDIGEDSWESLGIQGDPTSPSQRRSVLNIHWKDWCWSWNSNTLAMWWEEVTHLKRPWCWKRLRQGEKGMTEDEMVRWHHWLNGDEFGKTLGVDYGQGGLVCCGLWVTKSRTRLSNWTVLILNVLDNFCFYLKNVHLEGYLPKAWALTVKWR